jgi:TNF receptor-associated protein 1
MLRLPGPLRLHTRAARSLLAGVPITRPLSSSHRLVACPPESFAAGPPQRRLPIRCYTTPPDAVKGDVPPRADDDMVDEEADKPTDAGADARGATPDDTETSTGTPQNFGFQTETRQILDIVARSLYTEKEVFIRELISNASDALEKRRHLQLVSEADLEPNDAEPKIMLWVDEKKRTFTIQDTGIGMSKEELVENLGTIARSGSKAFIQKLKGGEVPADAAETIIGQFGVGFYSTFMVASEVKVYTRSQLKGAAGYLWRSDGGGDFTITEAEGVAPGSKIIMQLKETESTFSSQSVVERIIKKYSNFIGFKIFLNGKQVNTVEALWRKVPSTVTEEQHEEFFKYIASAYDKPLYRLHYKVDAPLSISSVFYIGQTHAEKFGVARLEPNVNLYCKKVLIQSKSKALLPEWMRFICGVVDSEDLPLNISRENTQDSSALRKLNTVLTKRILKWLQDEAKKDPTVYDKFFKEFGNFIKEGACMDQINKTDIAKLLRFESSRKEKGELVSLDDYCDRMVDGQDRIFFLHAPSREAALASPYYEQFRRKGIEVLFLHGHIDEYVMSHVEQYKTFRLLGVESPDIDFEKMKPAEDAPKDADETLTDALIQALTPAQCQRLGDYLLKALPGKLFEAKVSSRLSDSPAMVVTSHEQASMQRVMKQMAMMQGKAMSDMMVPPQMLEFNPKHRLVKRLYWLSRSPAPEDITRARLMSEQILDNALIAAGLLDDPRMMLGRLNTLLESALADVAEGSEPEPEAAQAAAAPAEGVPEGEKAADPKAA